MLRGISLRTTMQSGSTFSGANQMQQQNPPYTKGSIGVAVITHRAVSLLPQCLPPILQSEHRPKVLVVNSSSHDGTVELARERGAEVLIVPRSEFNHGATRELARRTLATDVVVMLTPDARPAGPEMLGRLVRPVIEGVAAVAYARQVPHVNAGFFESFLRDFNYPTESETRSIEDVRKIGPDAFFCSNVCAAWSNAALDEIGGFAPTLSLEDVIATAGLLNAGHRIAYCADAVVAHSHRYTLAQEFRRHFDIGYVRAGNRRLLFRLGGDERRGVSYTMNMLRRLILERPWLIPYGVAHVAAKYCGYKVGYHGHRLPDRLKRKLSAQDYFWRVSPTARDVAPMDGQPQAVI